MIYTGTFLGNDGTEHTLTISDGAGGTSQELELASDPFIVSYPKKDFFLPVRASKATISLLAGAPDLSLFTPSVHGVRVELDAGDNIEWQGYLEPNVYDQDTMTPISELELNAVDCLATLDSIPYQRDSNKIRSLLDVIYHIIDKSGFILNKLYIADIGKKLEDMYISDLNWSDEDDEAMKCRDVLEHIMQYLNLSAYQRGGDIIFMHPGATSYNTYNDQGVPGTAVSAPTAVDLSETNFYGTPTISMSEVYNKMSITSSLYSIDRYVPDILEGENLNVRVLNSGAQYDVSGWKYLVDYYDSNKYNEYSYNKDGTSYSQQVGPLNIEDIHGTAIIRQWGYNTSDSTPGETDYDFYVMHHLTVFPDQTAYTTKPIITYTSDCEYAFIGGYIVLSLDAFLSEANVPYLLDNLNASSYLVTGTPSITLSIGIGDKWYNGEWLSTKTQFTIPLGTKDDKYLNSWLTVKDTRVYSQHIKEKGYVISIPASGLVGKLTVELCCPYVNKRTGYKPFYTFMRNISITYDMGVDPDSQRGLTMADPDTDMVYIGQADGTSAKEKDNIDMYVTTDTGRGHSKSAVMHYANGNLQYLETIGNMIPEQRVLDERIAHYKNPHRIISGECDGLLSVGDKVKFGTSTFLLTSVSNDYHQYTSTITAEEL